MNRIKWNYVFIFLLSLLFPLAWASNIIRFFPRFFYSLFHRRYPPAYFEASGYIWGTIDTIRMNIK